MIPIVQCHRVVKRYTLGSSVIEALKGIDLRVAPGEFMAIVGPSGSGKSTLLHLIGCLDTPTAGTVVFDGQDLSSLSPDALAEIRAGKIGFVFQTFNLIPVLTAAENIEYPLLLKGFDTAKRREKVTIALEMVELGKFARHKPSELSGGQRQRVAIARALVTRPKLVLADEPTANLDHKTGEYILTLMKRINEMNGTTFIFSTHDPKIMKMANRVVELEDGQIVTHGIYRRRDSAKPAFDYLLQNFDAVMDRVFIEPHEDPSCG